MKPKILLIVIFVLCVTVAVSLWNMRSRPADQRPKTAFVEEPLSEQEVSRPKRTLQPANPADYGMVVTDPLKGSMSEEDINVLIHNKWKEINAQFPKETLEKAEETIKEDPQATREKMAKIETELARCRAVLKTDPFNEEMKRKERNLLMLKAIGKELAPGIMQ